MAVYGNTVLREGFFNRKKKETNRVGEATKAINKLIEYFNSNSNNSGEVYFYRENIINMGLSIYKIPEKKYIDHIIKTHEKGRLVNYYGRDPEYYNSVIKPHILSIPELKEPEKDNIIMIIDHDDYWLYIGEKSKKIFEIVGDELNKFNSLRDAVKRFDEFIFDYFNEEELIEADAKLGYYKLSKCPESEEKKPFPIKY